MLSDAAKFVWGESETVEVRQFTLLVPLGDEWSRVWKQSEMAGFVAGYVHNFAIDAESPIGQHPGHRHHAEFFATLLQRSCWPLSDEWTGSFAAVGFSIQQSELVLCNDLLGYQPLYYSVQRGGVWAVGLACHRPRTHAQLST